MYGIYTRCGGSGWRNILFDTVCCYYPIITPCMFEYSNIWVFVCIFTGSTACWLTIGISVLLHLTKLTVVSWNFSQLWNFVDIAMKISTLVRRELVLKSNGSQLLVYSNIPIFEYSRVFFTSSTLVSLLTGVFWNFHSYHDESFMKTFNNFFCKIFEILLNFCTTYC